MPNSLLDLCKTMGLAVDESSKAFLELKNKGLIYTPARTAKEFATRRYATRRIQSIRDFQYEFSPAFQRRGLVVAGPVA